MFLLLAVPTLILTLLVTVYVRGELREQAVEENQLVAQLVATSLSEEFYNLQRYVEDRARRRFLVQGAATANANLVRPRLSELVSQNSKITRAFATDASGRLIIDYPVTTNLMGVDFTDRDWFKGAAAQKRSYVSRIYARTNVDSAFVVTICTRIEDTNRRTVGYLGGQLTTDSLVRWLGKFTPDANHNILLLDQDGRPALRHQETDSLGLRSTVEKTTATNGWFLFANPSEGEYLASYVRVPSIGWTALSVEPTAQIFKPVDTLLKTILLFFVLCLLGMGILGYYWSKTISNYEERREFAEQELKTQAANLKRSNEELQGLCYSIAHDLRGPLRAVSGLAIALKEDYSHALDAVGLDYVSRLDGSAQRMDALTRDLLDYGRLSHVDLTFETIPLNTAVDKALQLYADEIQRKKGHVEVKQPLPVVRANPVVLEQVVANLVSNAVKFSKPDVPPRVELSAEEKGAIVLLRIKDNGIGIAPAFHQRIFGVFERLHNEQAFPGTGIGLAIVRKGVERLGGRIGLESQLGQGSCFWIELPKA